ncbi:MAG: hypothetical protein ATN35_03260 [Epulopiscium sp. Nele67-Bin004]|nr:MAG: hypothetical protein ATN35_03260 [Epulopiscium sp. Nele67-Bin004]
MRYFVTKSAKIPTTSLTFNLLESNARFIHGVVNELQEMGIDMTYSEVISDMLSAYIDSDGKIIQVNETQYSVQDLYDEAQEVATS